MTKSFAVAATELFREMGNDAAARGGYLRCETCGVRRELGSGADVGHYLGNGWPKHCGYTMRWWTARQVAAGEDVEEQP